MYIERVISLFDGMACGLTALKRAGIEVGEYHAFEIDKYAIQIAKKNHPEIIHHGGINFMTDFSRFKGADLLIGGSPCQGFSFAGKQLNFNDPRSQLFFEFVRAKREIKPKYFLLENVKMKKEYLDIISQQMGVEPILINSALVSAQNRNRHYWCNWKVEQPKDKGIFLKDIVEGNGEGTYIVAQRGRYNADGKVEQRLEPNYSGKSNTLTSVQKDNILMQGGVLRKLTVKECERLQTLPDGYTEGVSNTQRYKMLGNGWTVDVIVHLFNYLKPQPPTEEA